MKTIVAYTLKKENHTGVLVAKKGLFWDIQDAEGNIRKIPAKAVEETWEEAEDGGVSAAATEPPAEATDEVPVAPNQDNVPSLAEQASTGPTPAPASDSISLADLCTEYGVEARIARRKLRAAVADGKLTHDASKGWSFPRADIDDIMALITHRKRG